MADYLAKQFLGYRMTMKNLLVRNGRKYIPNTPGNTVSYISLFSNSRMMTIECQARNELYQSEL
jgi:hypothetical protein